MTPRARARARVAAALLSLGILGGGLIAAVVTTGAALADSDSDTSPVSVTIPGSPTPTPTKTGTPHPHPTHPGHPTSPAHPGAPGHPGGPGNGNPGGPGGPGHPGGPSGPGNPGHPGSGDPGGGHGSSPTPPHKPGTAPVVPKAPIAGTVKITITPQKKVFRAGDRLTASARGFTPNEKIRVVVYYLKRKPVTIGDFGADRSGALSGTFSVPKLDPGTDTVQFLGWDSQKVGSGTFLMGADSFGGTRPGGSHALWFGVGGCAGLAVVGVGAWIGIRSLLGASMLVTKV
ncbi:MAG TPA: hypothetical protein VGC45_09325 [Gryllotalpicola sp.]